MLRSPQRPQWRVFPISWITALTLCVLITYFGHSMAKAEATTPPIVTNAAASPAVILDDGAILISTSSSTPTLRLLYPLYSYPNWYQPDSYIWDDVAAANSQVPITAIINPNNGPDSCPPNSDYQRGLSDLRNGGVTILGYIYTSYGQRPLETVKAEVDLYRECFDVDGIFFDEAANDTLSLAYYQDLYSYVKTTLDGDMVIINPGSQIEQDYIKTPGGDSAIVFEDLSANWSLYQPDDYLSSGDYTAEHFAAIVHTVPDTDTMRSHLDLAVARNIGYVYITDDVEPNPFDQLPRFWQAEIDYIQALNGASSPSISAIYLPLILKNAGSGSDDFWQPASGTRWWWQLADLTYVDTSLDVEVYDIDLFDGESTGSIGLLRSNGYRVICYMSAGTYEPYREDMQTFNPAALLDPVANFEEERWLDIRQSQPYLENDIKPIMAARIQRAADAGCDAIEPDNVDGWENTNNVITYSDQLTYNQWIAATAHAAGLSVGLKNDLPQLSELVNDFDFAVNEQCYAYDECDLYLDTFLAQNKAVFNQEYGGPDEGTISQTIYTDQACAYFQANKFSSLWKDDFALDGQGVIQCQP